MGVVTESARRNPFRKRFPTITAEDLVSKRRRRIIADDGNLYSPNAFSSSWRSEAEEKINEISSGALNYSDPLSTNNLLKRLDSGKYGSVTKEIEDLLKWKNQFLYSLYMINPDLQPAFPDVQNKVDLHLIEISTPTIIDLDDDQGGESDAEKRLVPEAQLAHHNGVVVISDDENDAGNENHISPYQEVDLKQPCTNLLIKDIPSRTFVMKDIWEAKIRRVPISREVDSCKAEPGLQIACETELEKDKGVYVGTDDDMEYENDELSDANADGLDDIWNEMKIAALECSKDTTEDALLDKYDAEDEECEHSFIFKDDIGDVCRICGVIKRGIETIIEYNFSKSTRTTKTYRYEGGRTIRQLDDAEIFPDGMKLSDSDFTGAEIHPHPRHGKEMKPHQVEGFNFLLSNLVTDNPGGCIMAHAPGSGKTFMIISFLQSFMAKYPAARPLVVLPKGILNVWQNEFKNWQVEDLPLYDFYSKKADSRPQQLEVLKAWVKERSILFLGYKQFSSIICDPDAGDVAVACQNYLLKIPTILILDEGHTPRNQDTDVLTSLERVETARKVVLSGTLYQNHVREVFNILNLVRPKFLKMETSKIIKRRILSRAEIFSRRNLMKNGRDNDFYDLIEHSLSKDENPTRKMTVIQDLREMTRKVLHYYKGDNLDELPGLVDFSVFLELSLWQKAIVKELTKSSLRKFTVSAQGSAIYLHPKLKDLAKSSGVKDRIDVEKINAIIDNKLNTKEGCKLNFYLNLLQLCESSGEKVLVFSQYLLPLNFLQMLTAKVKGYQMDKEMFMITGDSDFETRGSSVEKFNVSSESRVFFGSIKACGEGISLVGASRIIILDVHLNPSVTRQAIGRAFRPGQKRKVYVYRLIASGSPEEEDHTTCFRKESISKMWFEWDESKGHQSLDMETVDIANCGDSFLDTRLNENVTALCKR